MYSEQRADASEIAKLTGENPLRNGARSCTTLAAMRLRTGLMVVLIGLSAAGCKRSDTDPATDQKPGVKSGSSEEVIARLHWLGKKRLAGETNAAHFMRIWEEPVSARLQAQVLDKLAVAPWRKPLTNSVSRFSNDRLLLANSPAALLRPLLDDLVQEESCLEIRKAANGTGELAIAIRLGNQRFGLWATNLAAVLKSLGAMPAGAAPTHSTGWRLAIMGSQTATTNYIELSRVGDWSLIGLAQGRNSVLPDMAARIQSPRTHAPFLPRETNFWLEAHLDMAKVASVFSLGWNLPGDFPKVSATVIGDGENVHTHGLLEFQKPLSLRLRSWQIPTNLVNGPLVSFTAARDVEPLFNGLKPFAELPSAERPQQAYLWDREGLPFQMFFALQMDDARHAFLRIAPLITNLINQRLTPNYGSVSVDSNSNRLAWTGLSHASPFMEAVMDPGSQFIFGGFAPVLARTSGVPPELLNHILNGTNLVYFDWEITGRRLQHWRYLDDVYRIVFDAHGPLLLFDSPSLQWMAANLTNLSHSVTELKTEGPNRLAFARKSSVGCTALELNLLANWLGMPTFPSDLSSILKTNGAPRGLRRHSR